MATRDPLLHYRNLEWPLAHEAMTRCAASTRISLERDQAASPVGEAAQVPGNPKVAPVRDVLWRDRPAPVGVVLHPRRSMRSSSLPLAPSITRADLRGVVPRSLIGAEASQQAMSEAPCDPVVTGR